MRHLLLSLALAALPAAAHAQDAAPAEPAPAPAPAHPARGGVRIVAHQQLVLLLNPMGAEHAFDLSVRGPIGDQDDLLFHGAHVMAGAVTYVSPVYAIGGGYVEVAPVSFLVLRAEITGGGMWPIGMDGAGYFTLSGYDDPRAHDRTLAADQAHGATGWSFSGSATLQGMLPIGPVRVLMANELSLTRTVLGSGAHYYSMKHDLVLAREDVVLQNCAFVGLELDAASDLLLRFGAYDDVRYVPQSGYLGHQAGPLVMLEWAHVADGVDSLGVFVRGGWYTHHVSRTDEATILGGVALSYDLGGIP